MLQPSSSCSPVGTPHAPTFLLLLALSYSSKGKLMVFVIRNSSNPASPHSRAFPLCLYPPNGAFQSMLVPLTITMPDLNSLATASARLTSEDATALLRPH